MKLKNIIFLFFVITLLGCAEKFEDLDNLENLLGDESVVLFEVTEVSFIPQSAFVSDVKIDFKSNYNDLSDELREKINQIAVFKNNIFQFTINNPTVTSFIDENEPRFSNHCYQFAYARNTGSFNTGQGTEISRLNEKECFTVE